MSRDIPPSWPIMLRLMRLDILVTQGKRTLSSVIAYLFPLLFALSAAILPSKSAIVLMACLTMGYWTLTVGTLFSLSLTEESTRIIALLPASRRTQVRARYATMACLFLWGCVQLAVECVIGVLAFGLDLSGSGPAFVGAALMFALLYAVQMPVYYAYTFAQALNRIVLASALLGMVVFVCFRTAPASVIRQVEAAAAMVPFAGWCAIALAVAAAALTASYRLSLRVWSKREL